MNILDLALEFALLVFVGVFIIKVKIVDQAFLKNMSRFVMKVALPCLIFNSIRAQHFGGDFKELLVIIGLALVILALLAVTGVLYWLLTGRTLFGKCVIFSTMFSNYTYIGMSVVEKIFDASGLFVYTVFTLPIRLFFYAAPSFLMKNSIKKEGKKTFKERISPFISPPTAAVAIGLVFYFSGIGLPTFIDSTLKTIGSLASPLGMLICGMSLAGVSVKSLSALKNPLGMVLVRNFIAPAVVIGVLYLLPVESYIAQAVAIYGCVPVPSLITAFAMGAGCSDEVCRDCSAGVLISTLLSVLTLPMWVSVIFAVL